MLGLVTQTSVYHWSIEGKMPFFGLNKGGISYSLGVEYFLFHGLIHVYGIFSLGVFWICCFQWFCCISHLGDSEPVKMFERTANLVNNQIINYRCDPSEKWLVLIGIAPGSPEVCNYFSSVLCQVLQIIFLDKQME